MDLADLVEEPRSKTELPPPPPLWYLPHDHVHHFGRMEIPCKLPLSVPSGNNKVGVLSGDVIDRDGEHFTSSEKLIRGDCFHQDVCDRGGDSVIHFCKTPESRRGGGVSRITQIYGRVHERVKTIPEIVQYVFSGAVHATLAAPLACIAISLAPAYDH